jgi:hypothetical protein
MKSILWLVIFFMAATVTSCNKCYECKTSSSTETYCKESPAYSVIKDGATLTDSNGEKYNCKLK